MFLHIPEDVFSTQINGNVEEALKVLKVTTEKLERKSRRFSRDLSLDPENPITQVSKTPSDEEFPWQWDDIFPDDDNVTATSTTGEIIQQTEEVSNKAQNPVDLQDGKEEKTVNIDGENNDIETNNVEKNIEDKGSAPDSEPDDEKIIFQPAAEAEEIADDKEKNNFEDLNAKNDETAIDEKEDFKLVLKRPPTSFIKSKCLVKDVVKFIEEMKNKISAEDLDMRVIPSNSACRFELPIDMTRLKEENPLSYLTKYCYATETRKAVYAQKYEKYIKKKHKEFLTVLDLGEIYESVFSEAYLKDEILHLRRLLNLDSYIKLDMDMFIKCSCLMERIILKSQKWRPFLEYKKNLFEVVDFCGLKGKLHGIELTQEMLTLLEYIRYSQE
ncbi:uncharacterized protein LOC118193386 [Stegodyphus dumicola]|uniref:uncharacterized protein LOC118193386 n=1 Tax=Stegodyphus dumicola TaxID=202533 RepID=UPI0015AC6EB3|nr:uncharacterized protein LOC118193386 [Stegodyphus dumicola]